MATTFASVVAAISLMLAIPASAQEDRFAGVTIKTETLAPGVAVLSAWAATSG